MQLLHQKGIALLQQLLMLAAAHPALQEVLLPFPEDQEQLFLIQRPDRVIHSSDPFIQLGNGDEAPLLLHISLQLGKHRLQVCLADRL
ncbi:hypothetical protein D3C73_1437530 [compost metagenome]